MRSAVAPAAAAGGQVALSLVLSSPVFLLLIPLSVRPLTNDTQGLGGLAQKMAAEVAGIKTVSLRKLR